MAVLGGGGGPRAGGSVEWFKGSFFDAGKVMKEMDKATRRVFSKFGAFVRQRSRSSIRYRKAAAPPGQPPSGHRSMMRTKTNRKTGVTKRQPASPLRDLILFAYDATTQTLVVGPALFAGARRPRVGGKTIPEVLEKGGAALVVEALTRGRWRVVGSVDAAAKTTRPTRRRTAPVGRRPFMGPALAAELPKLAPMYAKSF